MPLVKGNTPQAIAQNIEELVKNGRPVDQAAAIAYKAAHGEDRAGGIMYRAGDSVLLLLRSASAGDYPLHWCFPGGGIDDGENPEQAAIRESMEEVGYTPDAELSPFDYSDGFTTFAVGLNEQFAPVLNHEHLGYVWAPIEYLPQPLHPGVAETLASLPVSVAAMDDEWITVHPNGSESTGQHVLLGEGGEVKGGMGGKFNGQNISQAKESKNNPAKTKKHNDAHSVVKNDFSNEEKKGIENYTSDKADFKKGIFKPAYQEINSSLRKDGSVSESHKKTVEILDKTFQKASSLEDFTVYRGVSEDFANKLKSGTSFYDKGFVSTTSDKNIAGEFSGSKGVLMEISVPKGSKAISLAKSSKHPEEKEILLNRNGKYKITGESKNESGKRILHVEYQG